MERVLYVVFRERPLLVGYLTTMLGSRSSDGRLVEIKLDERRGERRRSGAARDPDRRSGERRLQPSLDHDLRSRGYAAVFQAEASPSRGVAPLPAPSRGWRPRSTWRQRTARAGRRNRFWWGAIVALLVVLGVAVVAARSIH
jgi:hypothetical protein